MITALILFLIFAVNSLSQSLQPDPIPVIEPPPVLQWGLIEDWNSWDSSLWAVDLSPVANAIATTNNVVVKNGSLHLIHSKGSDGRYYVGRVLSKPRLPPYGQFEARIRFNGVAGWHEGFFLVCADTLLPPSRNIEIDIIEMNTYNPRFWGSRYQTWTDGIHPQKQAKSTIFWTETEFIDPQNDLTQWHIYGLVWTPTTISMYIDNRTRFTHVYDNVVNPINVWFTTSFLNSTRFPLNDSVLPTEMEIDYFKYIPYIQNL